MLYNKSMSVIMIGKSSYMIVLREKAYLFRRDSVPVMRIFDCFEFYQDSSCLLRYLEY